MEIRWLVALALLSGLEHLITYKLAREEQMYLEIINSIDTHNLSSLM